LDQRLQMVFRLSSAVERIEIGRHLDRSVTMQRRRRGDALVGLDRELGLLQRLVKIGERQKRQRMIGLQIKRELQIDETEVLPAAAAERRAETVERFG